MTARTGAMPIRERGGHENASRLSAAEFARSRKSGSPDEERIFTLGSRPAFLAPKTAIDNRNLHFIALRRVPPAASEMEEPTMTSKLRPDSWCRRSAGAGSTFDCPVPKVRRGGLYLSRPSGVRPTGPYGLENGGRQQEFSLCFTFTGREAKGVRLLLHRLFWPSSWPEQTLAF